MEDSPAKITGVGCHALLQGIFLTQGSNPGLLCLLQWQAVSLPPGKPYVKGIILQKTTLTSDVSCKFRGLQLPALTTSWLKIQGFHDHLRFNNLLEWLTELRKMPYLKSQFCYIWKLQMERHVGQGLGMPQMQSFYILLQGIRMCYPFSVLVCSPTQNLIGALVSGGFHWNFITWAQLIDWLAIW